MKAYTKGSGTVRWQRTRALHAAQVWLQTLAPHQKTPIHKHDCEELNIATKASNETSLAVLNAYGHSIQHLMHGALIVTDLARPNYGYAVNLTNVPADLAHIN